VTDARFEDGEEGALRLTAQGPEDLAVISALVQDAVVAASDLSMDRKRRAFSLLLNRFRWEDRGAGRRPPERVRSVLTIADVRKVQAQGISRADPTVVLSLLSIAWEPGEDGTGALVLTFAGDGALRLEVEALDITLTDVTKPYLALSRRTPDHPG
jgi:Protein of unknown function (DUF2948)